MKTSIPLSLFGPVGAAALSLASCSVRQTSYQRSVTGIVEAVNPEPAGVPPGGVNQVTRESTGPLPYLVFLNILRAPFLPLIGIGVMAGSSH